MKKAIIYLLILHILVGIVYASDLSNFPDMFVDYGTFDAVIVVGNQAPASDAIAQSNIVQFYISFLGKTLVGSTKLSSEVSTLDQNIISIGSPCHNPVSAQIMGNPQPCNKLLEPGKALIILYDYKGYVHMVIAGYSDKGTRDAVNVLINYGKNALKGSSILIEVDEPKPEVNKSIIEEKVEEKIEEVAINIEEEKEKLISELNERIANKSKEASKKTISITSNKSKGKIPSEQKEEIEIGQKKEINVIKRILEWILSLFKRS